MALIFLQHALDNPRNSQLLTMPPRLSDEELSDAENADRRTKDNQRTGSGSDDEQVLQVESDNNGGSQDGSDNEEEIYVVEKIVAHSYDEQEGIIKYQVRWEGYDKDDMTWEPEENLQSADVALNKYFKKYGGRAALLESIEEKAKIGKKGGSSKKRQRASTSQAATNGKRSRKSEPHPADTTPPASVTEKEFQPPRDWESNVQAIDACEEGGEIVVFLTWLSGEKTKHPLEVVYKRCPQKMLNFYERHLVFKPGDA